LLPFLLGIYKMLGRLAGNLAGTFGGTALGGKAGSAIGTTIGLAAGGPVGAAVGGALGTAIGGFTGGTIGGDIGKEVLGKKRMAGQIDPRLLMMTMNTPMPNPNTQSYQTPLTPFLSDQRNKITGLFGLPTGSLGPGLLG